MKQLIFIIVLFLYEIVFAQNQVINPSFEEFYDCPRDISFFHKNVKHWSIPNNGTTDYFNSCSEKMGFKNFIGFQKARTGNGYAGIHVFYKKNYREYIQGKLKNVLVRGKKYRVTFYVSLADSSKYALRELGFMATGEKFNVFKSKAYIDAKAFSSRMSNVKYHPIIKKEFLLNSSEWVKISFKYTAEGYERFFSIGNFDSNASTEKSKVIPLKPDVFSYYYIDDVSIEPIEQENEIDVVESEKQDVKPEIRVNKTHTFNNVLFDFDKAELLEVSLDELNDLQQYLKEHPDLNIEIYGHTDNKGLDKRNKELSEQRAKAVADYLISHGLNLTRIKSFGFGSSNPVSSNDTKGGRQLNRRVEFKLIEN
ncbi:OmpA family protein [Winogradskyella luteola]|uniref:OmpA family protein n=1 Tax=Winogradskyella luteola TaxID=2828330 RepID=A0A9X1F7T3_9FLAO|nr:OmpA family protein [Winogradskyella luteola]MBV7269027.1 OmpA family protein [Winogradskyella luteola]